MEMANEFSWLNRPFFRKMIKSIHQSEQLIELNLIKAIAATKPGDNYCSNMYRVTINYTLNGVPASKTVIIKAFPTNPTAKIIATQNKTFDIEINAYNYFVNEIDSMLSNITTPIKISPYYYGDIPGHDPSLCLEDLKELGFEMFPPAKQFDLDQTKMILTKLAKFHACSVIVDEKHPEYKNSFLVGTITVTPEREIYNNFVKLSLRSIGDLIAAKDNKNQSIKECLYKLAETIIEDCEKNCFTYDQNNFNVLTHNDLWVNNLMFKRKSNDQIEDIVLVDFQFVYWGSPAIDLNYFLHCSVQLNVIENNFDSLVKHYHDEFCSTLKSFCYKKPIISLTQLQLELLRTATIGIIPAFCCAAMLLKDPSQEVNFSVLLEDSPKGDEYRKKMHMSPEYIKFIEGTIAIFYKNGYLK